MSEVVVPCGSCGAKIIWVRDQKGTRLPLNKTRVRVYGSPDSEGHVFYDINDKGKPNLHHISHFITCPNASEHSKGTL